MSRIRKLYWFDKKNTEEMLSFLNNRTNDSYINKIMYNPFLLLHYFLPLRCKFLPESFVMKSCNEFKGLITIAPTKTTQKMEIQKLFFKENALFEAAELVQYAVSKYKAMGAFSIIVKVDDYMPELLTMLVSKCGFNQISYEKLWRITKFPNEPFDNNEFRSFKNSDAKAITNIYNDSLLPHFRPLLGAEVREFKEKIFKGLSYYTEYKYVIEDKNSKAIIGCVFIKTLDNENFTIEILQTSWIELNINSILNFAIKQIKKRKKRFGVFVKTKRYLTIGEKQEEIFKNNAFECVQNQILLTNSSAKLLKDNANSSRFVVLSDLISTKPLVTN